MPITFPRATRGGTYYRVCGPDWKDPSDTAYARVSGGRWNPPGSFGVLYLNASLEGARANARRFIYDQFGPDVLPEDIQPAYLPDAAAFAVDITAFVDAVTRRSRANLRLAAAYAPRAGYHECRRVGTAAYAAAEDGIATASAVVRQSEELAIFDRSVERVAHAGRRRRFRDWWAPQ